MIITDNESPEKETKEKKSERKFEVQAPNVPKPPKKPTLGLMFAKAFIQKADAKDEEKETHSPTFGGMSFFQ